MSSAGVALCPYQISCDSSALEIYHFSQERTRACHLISPVKDRDPFRIKRRYRQRQFSQFRQRKKLLNSIFSGAKNDTDGSVWKWNNLLTITPLGVCTVGMCCRFLVASQWLQMGSLNLEVSRTRDCLLRGNCGPHVTEDSRLKLEPPSTQPGIRIARRDHASLL